MADLDRARIRERAIARFDVDRMVTAYERLYHALIEEGAGKGTCDRLNGSGSPSEPRPLMGIRVGGADAEHDGRHP